jgi:hypothetical protein
MAMCHPDHHVSDLRSLWPWSSQAAGLPWGEGRAERPFRPQKATLAGRAIVHGSWHLRPLHVTASASSGCSIDADQGDAIAVTISMESARTDPKHNPCARSAACSLSSWWRRLPERTRSDLSSFFIKSICSRAFRRRGSGSDGSGMGVSPLSKKDGRDGAAAMLRARQHPPLALIARQPAARPQGEGDTFRRLASAGRSPTPPRSSTQAAARGRYCRDAALPDESPNRTTVIIIVLYQYAPRAGCMAPCDPDEQKWPVRPLGTHRPSFLRLP